MDFVIAILLGIVFLGFGFFSFQKGREYERNNGQHLQQQQPTGNKKKK